MKHPRNKGDRIYYKKARVNKFKKEYPVFVHSNYWPIYAKNRGQSWRTWPVNCDYTDGAERRDFETFSGRFKDEPVYLHQRSKNGYKKFFKRFAIRQARRNRRYKLKGCSYKKVYDRWNWD